MANKVYNRVQINRLLNRGRKILHALSRKPEIRRVADHAGYTEKEHELGWSLLLFLMGYKQAKAQTSPPYRSAYDDAVAKLDLWDGPHFERTRAALNRHHPEQAAYIFNDLQAGTGVDSVGAVNTFVMRVVALRDGTDPTREATRVADKAAVDTLESRKIFNAETESYLRELIEIATAGAPSPAMPELPVEDNDPAYQAKAAEFDMWLTDWRRTLRSSITRRDYLIQLGLVSRRGKAKEEDTDV